MIAQTLTSAAHAVADAGPLAQILGAIVAGLLLAIPLAFAWARAKIATATAAAEAERLEAEARLAAARRAAEAAQALTSTVIRGVEAIADEDARRKTKGAIKAFAEGAGLEPTLNAAVKEVTQNPEAS